MANVAPRTGHNSRGLSVWLLCAGLMLLTLLPYLQVSTFDFVLLDDPQYVLESELVQRGLDPLASIFMPQSSGIERDRNSGGCSPAIPIHVEPVSLTPGGRTSIIRSARRSKPAEWFRKRSPTFARRWN